MLWSDRLGGGNVSTDEYFIDDDRPCCITKQKHCSISSSGVARRGLATIKFFHLGRFDEQVDSDEDIFLMISPTEGEHQQTEVQITESIKRYRTKSFFMVCFAASLL